MDGTRYTRADVARLLNISKDAARHAFERLPAEHKTHEATGTWTTDADGLELIRTHRASAPMRTHSHPMRHTEAHTPDKSVTEGVNPPVSTDYDVSDAPAPVCAPYAEDEERAPMRTPTHTVPHPCFEDCAYLRDLQKSCEDLRQERDGLQKQIADLREERDAWKVHAAGLQETVALHAKVAAAQSVKEITGKPSVIERVRQLFRREN